MYHVSSPNEPFPSAASLAQATTTHTQGRFRVASRKLPISKSGAIDAMSARLGIPVPEMIFGDNMVSVTHVPSGWRVEFTAEAALDAVDKTGRDMLRVAHAGEWSSSREKTSAGIREVVRPFDWSYSTTYRGTVVRSGEKEELNQHQGQEQERQPQVPASNSQQAEPLPPPPPPTSTYTSAAASSSTSSSSADRFSFSPVTDPSRGIPLELLRRRDPILFADEVVLYESELDDNGISVVSVKFRVMRERMLLLCRLFVRVDGVVCRVRDTRVYVDFARDLVIRDYVTKEQSCDVVSKALLRTGLLPDAVTVAMRDPVKVDSVMPEAQHEVESLQLSSI